MNEVTEIKLTIYARIGAKGEVLKYAANKMPRAQARADKAWYNANAFAVKIETKIAGKWTTVRYQHRN